ncbi:hypothetical protein L6Q96_13780 [Candidatus Binatia bacterium]|nr:hypothetical protein [Candidatus Binatia bacterium]
MDVGAITDASRAGASGIAHAAALIELADAMVGSDEESLAGARQRVLTELGAPPLVDAVAVASNFERMVRIADGTGIPLDDPVAIMTSDLREQLGIDRFTAAANTPPPGVVRRLLTPILRPLLARMFRGIGRTVR